jgi:hypothetical protein
MKRNPRVVYVTSHELLLQIREVLTDKNLSVEARWLLATGMAFPEWNSSPAAFMKSQQKLDALAGFSQRTWDRVHREMADDMARIEGRPVKQRTPKNKRRDEQLRKLLQFPVKGKPN